FDLGGVVDDDDVATNQFYVDLRCQVSQGITDRGWSGSGHKFAMEQGKGASYANRRRAFASLVVGPRRAAVSARVISRKDGEQ
ncbi:MAG: hypothetical protein ACREVM_05170, partial [Burkholderiales bacterium]